LKSRRSPDGSFVCGHAPPDFGFQNAGIHIDENQLLTFVAKTDHQIFKLNLVDETYTPHAAYSFQQPDNILGFGGNI